MALGLTLGIVLAVSGGGAQHTAIQQAAANATASASPSASASGAGSPSASPSASASAAPAPDPVNVSCDIIVPAHPLSAAGLATPYQLTGTDGASPDASGCTMANFASLGAFVQATILNPWTGQIAVYNPLVITAGTKPAVAPVRPRLPRGSVVTIDFGFNGTNLNQVGATRNALREGNCTGGLGSSTFGQVSFCNGTQFFRAASWSEWFGRLRVPSAGRSRVTGQACPTVRSFQLVDQDQSDNVTSTYLLDPATGQTAQNTTANAANLPGATPIANGSDNVLLDAFLDPALGCKPFEAPDLSNGGTPGTSQALDELQAARSQSGPVALVPENDEMALVDNNFSVAKTNLYRSEVGQPAVSWSNQRTDNPATYCQDMINLQSPFLAAHQGLLAGQPTPVAGTGNNLFTFMANRLDMSFTNLNCQNFGLTDPVSVTLDQNGVAVAATINTTQQQASSNGSGHGQGPGQRRGRHHHQYMDPSGM